MGSKSTEDKKKKKSKNKANKDEAGNHEGSAPGNSDKRKIIDDPRFASVHTDPRFQRVPKHKSKVVIDSRFDRMFTDKSFASSSAPLDKRGKRKKQSSVSNLRRYYQIEDEEGKDEKKKKRRKKEEEKVTHVEEEEGEEEEEEEEQESEREELESESEEDLDSDVEESTTDEDEEEVDYDDEMPEVEVEKIEVTEDSTRRLAIVNMDWNHVRAEDLYVVLSSFLPRDGCIESVAVYPSEFGLERMKEEEVHGPIALLNNKKNKDEEDEDDDEDDDDEEIDDDKLRAYEKSRLRYYFGMVQCDTVATADHLYKACDGVEFERTSNVLDLRFVPDSMEFKHPPRDVATEAPTSYEGLDFHTKALQHSNIPISWDDDDPKRVKTLKRKFNDDQLAEMDLNEYLASETDNDDDNSSDDQLDKKQTKLERYRALINSADGSDEDGEEDGHDMEVTFNPGLEDLSKRILEKKDKKSQTVWEETLRKIREKKAARKHKSKYSSEEETDGYTDEEEVEEPDDFFVEEPSAKKANKKKDAKVKSDQREEHLKDTDKAAASAAELELLLTDNRGAEDGVKGYNLKPKKAKGKKGKEVPDESKLPTADLDDPRFSLLYTSPLFQLDPTDPQFKRSAAYARQVAEKQRRRGDKKEVLEGKPEKLPTNNLSSSGAGETNKDEATNSDVSQKKREKHELSSMVKSIKMKAMQAPLPPKGKKTSKR